MAADPTGRLTLPRPSVCRGRLQHRGPGARDFEYLFARGKGLVSIRYGGVQLLDDTVRLNFWRAPTNNDEGCAAPSALLSGKPPGCMPSAIVDLHPAGNTRSRWGVYTLPDGGPLPVNFLSTVAGRCEATLTWQGAEAELPELGLLFRCGPSCARQITWALAPRDRQRPSRRGRMGR